METTSFGNVRENTFVEQCQDVSLTALRAFNSNNSRLLRVIANIVLTITECI